MCGSKKGSERGKGDEGGKRETDHVLREQATYTLAMPICMQGRMIGGEKRRKDVGRRRGGKGKEQ